MRKSLSLSLSALLLCLAAAPAAAAPVLVLQGQTLAGATGVLVNGTSYDVEFVEGTCIALFTGCDAAADFTFQTQADATAASQALLDQVLTDGALGNFEAEPWLTLGCTDPGNCLPQTPFGLVSTLVETMRAVNDALETNDAVAWGGAAMDTDTTGFTWSTWARSTPTDPPSVPEPATAALVVLGLAAAVRQRR